MDERIYREYVAILEEELQPAMGCTEPIAIAYAAAKAREVLGCEPDLVKIGVSNNIIKNVKSVVVPNTDGMKGIEAAAVAGILGGNAAKELEVISEVTANQKAAMRRFLSNVPISVEAIDNGIIFDIIIALYCGTDSAVVRISQYHTNIVYIKKNDEVLLDNTARQTSAACNTEAGSGLTDRSLLTIANIYDFAETCDLDDVRSLLDTQILYNTQISEEGLLGDYGANVGSTYLKFYGNDVRNRAIAKAAAGSDARMSGCELPVVINSGNANAATGTQGIEDARTVEREAEKLLGVGENEVFVCSTGVIGQKLPVEKVLDGVRQIIPAKLDKDNGSDAAYAIMTTDTVRKESAYELELSSGTIRIGAMAKGSGMIHPNMATTLAYVTTDAKCDSADLQKMLHNAIDKSFNMCTVDGDTSTNDTMILLANGASGVEVKTEEDKAALVGLIEHICIDMARRIASDGEGATHLIVVESYGLPTEHDARLVAKAIAGSTLFKAAVFGRDANWGRIMAAAGYSGADVDPTKADCIIKSSAGEVQVMKDGFGTDFSEELAKAVLTEHDITVIVDFHSGDGKAVAYGCDLTYEYVKINGDYRT